MSKVLIYTAPQCPRSKELKEFLATNNIAFEEKCVIDSPEVFEELYGVSEQRAIPVTVVDDDKFVGYDRRVERRLRRKLGV